MNRDNILEAIDRMIDELERLREALSEPDDRTRLPLHDYFAGAKNTRDGLK